MNNIEKASVALFAAAVIIAGLTGWTWQRDIARYERIERVNALVVRTYERKAAAGDADARQQLASGTLLRDNPDVSPLPYYWSFAAAGVLLCGSFMVLGMSIARRQTPLR